MQKLRLRIHYDRQGRMYLEKTRDNKRGVIVKDSFGITLKVQPKHAALHEAATKMGSQSALARHLGVQPSVVGEWCNMNGVPSSRWSEEKRNDIEKKLFDLTGQLLCDLFPDELRNNKEFLDSKKTFEATKMVSLKSLECAKDSRLQLPSASDEAGENEWHEMLGNKIRSAVRSLSGREGEILKLRFGLGDGYEYTLDECASIFGVTRERIRQIESKAIRKLQQPRRIEPLQGLALAYDS